MVVVFGGMVGNKTGKSGRLVIFVTLTLFTKL